MLIGQIAFTSAKICWTGSSLDSDVVSVAHPRQKYIHSLFGSAAVPYGSKTFRNLSVPCKVYFCRVSELSGVCVRATHKTFFSQLLCPNPPLSLVCFR